MKVLYVTNLPAPYKIKFFLLLAKKVELTVAYERRKAENRDAKWICGLQDRTFEEIYLDGIKTGADTSCSLAVVKLIQNRKFDLIIMNGFSSMTSMLTITYMQLHKITYWIACDGMLPNDNSRLREWIKKYLISNAGYYLSPNEITSEVLRRYGAKEEQIYMYPFSSISETEFATESYDKKIYKRKIGCDGKKIILYVGQFIYRKGIDVLMKAYEQIRNDENHLILIGGGGALRYQLI